MILAMRSAWPLLVGILLLMIGNGLQGNLLAYRGGVEGFSPVALSVIMSSYFAGFFVGARVTTGLIRQVGHVRVFAAYGSFISAAFITFPLIPNEVVWALARFVIGICFAGVYIVAESWLNNATENDNRGKVLSAYVFVQMLGILVSAILIGAAKVDGYTLFIIMSILVSLSFAPILLSNTKAPVFESTESMSLRELYTASPLGSVAVFLVGGMFALQFSMVGVYTTAKGYGVENLSIVFAAIYVAALVAQYPVGWLSDRMDRRWVIIGLCAFGSISIAIGLTFATNFYVIVAMAAVSGACSNPLWSVTLAYINDRVAWHKMAAASAGILLLNGIGAIGAPILVGYLMQVFGADMFWMFFIVLFAGIAVFGIFRATQRDAVDTDDISADFVAVGQSASPVIFETTQEYVSEQYEAAVEEAEEAEVAENQAATEAENPVVPADKS